MLLMLIEKGYPLDEVVFYDTGMEFQSIYNLRDKVMPLLESKGIKFTQLQPRLPFSYMMFEKPICKRGTNEIHRHGHSWCGFPVRWGTKEKLNAIQAHCKGHYEYVGIATDEPKRLEKKRKGNKLFPLAEWQMTEQDCLEYCYSRGYVWDENGVDLYSIFNRVSCWCCGFNNLSNLKNMYLYLPDYWQKLKEIQAKLPEPMKGKGKSVFELEERFRAECEQQP